MKYSSHIPIVNWMLTFILTAASLFSLCKYIIVLLYLHLYILLSKYLIIYFLLSVLFVMIL